MSDIERRYSDPMIYDISIDWDDSADGSDGGYDKHANFVVPSAMQEIVRLRAENERLRSQLEKDRPEPSEALEALERVKDWTAEDYCATPYARWSDIAAIRRALTAQPAPAVPELQFGATREGRVFVGYNPRTEEGGFQIVAWAPEWIAAAPKP